MNSNPHIKILILNYNGKHIIQRCLDSVFKLEYNNFSVDVIDNGSNDNSIEIINNLFNDVTIHQIGENLGYAQGYNFCFDKLKKDNIDYYLLLNNDAIVVSDLIINLLLNVEKYGSGNIYGPKIYYSNTSRLWFAGGLYSKFLGITRHIGMNQFEDNICYKTKQTDYITGCCMLISKKIIDKLNGFEKKYKMYYEDVDLCHRAYLEGVKCFIIEGQAIAHDVSYTIKNNSIFKKYHMFISQIKFIYKFNNPVFFIISMIINIFLMPLYPLKRFMKL